MNNTVTGKIKLINDEQTYGSFTKREFILTIGGKYPQDIKFELYQEACPAIDKYSVGDQVEVQYNLKGNEYKGKYYVNLQAWKLGSPDQAATPGPDSPEIGTEDFTDGVEELEDAPF